MRQAAGAFLIVLLFVATAGVTKADGAGMAVSPATVSLSDVLRGGSAEQIIQVYNPDPANAISYTISVNDTIKDAISVTPSSGTIPAKSSASVTVAAKVPQTKANGQYNGTLTIDQQAPANGAGRIGAVTVPSLSVQVSYSVTDQQKLSLKVLDLQYFDTEEGLPFVIALNATNEGNVDATPTLKVRLSDLNNTTVLTREISTIIIAPSKTANATTTAPNNLSQGQYHVHTDVVLGNDTLYNKTGLVEVFAKGALRTKGELLVLSIGNSVFFNTGDIVKIAGTFRNTGQLPVSPRLVCEIRADSDQGKLVDVAQGDPVAVTPGQTVNLTAYYTPKDPGQYAISGHAAYGNKITETQGTMINVANSGPNLLTVALIGVIIVAALGAIGYYYTKRRRE